MCGNGLTPANVVMLADSIASVVTSKTKLSFR
jgi:hypothetical protein